MGQSQSVPEVSKVSSCQSASSLVSNVSGSAKRSSKVDGRLISFPEDLTNYREGEVKVKSLGIYMKPLPSKQPLALPVTAFTHHFLIINVDSVEMPDGREEKLGFIKAEKGKGDNFGEITVECFRGFRPMAYGEKRVCRLVADCGTIPMQKVLDILEEPSSDNYFLTENCWKYADQTFRGLIEEFSNRAEPESETKKNLQSYLKALPPLRMPGDALNWSGAEALDCSVPPAVASGSYLTYIGGLAGRAAWIASKVALAVLPVLGLGSATPLAGPVALQVSLKLAAAAAVTSSYPGTVVANHIPAATLLAAIKLGGCGAAGVHIAALSKVALVAAVTAMGSPHVSLTALAVVGVGVAGLFLV